MNYELEQQKSNFYKEKLDNTAYRRLLSIACAEYRANGNNNEVQQPIRINSTQQDIGKLAVENATLTIFAAAQ